MEGTPIAGWIISWKIRKNDNNWGYPRDLGNLHILLVVVVVVVVAAVSCGAVQRPKAVRE